MENSFPGHFGIEISKDDLDHFSPSTLTHLVLDNKLVLIRSLSLTPNQLVAYGDKLGKLYVSATDLSGNGEAEHVESEHHQQITVVSREGLHDNSIVDWHIDLLHKPSDILPGRFLYSHDAAISSRTSWADTSQAYELISHDIREFVEESACFYMAPYHTDWIGAVRLMVSRHPLLETKSLLVDQIFTRCIIGETHDYTDDLKTAVLDQILTPDNVYVHDWHEGDLIIYDNNSTMHRREPMADDTEGDRTLWRLTFDFDL